MASKFRDWYKTQKQEHMKRHQESIDRKQGVRFGTIFMKEKVPQGIPFWKCGEGEHILDVIPFESGPDVPTQAPEGTIENYIDLHVHGNVGILEQTYVCPLYTWTRENLKCPICSYLSKYGKNHTDEQRYSMKAKRRCIYLVWVHDNDTEEKKGLQIWEVAHFFFQDKIDTLAQRPRGGGIIQYAAIEKSIGKQIVFQRQGTGPTSTTYLGHQFMDRTEEIPDFILDQSFPLDSCIKIRPTYEEIEKAFFEGEAPAEMTEEEGPPHPAEAYNVPETEYQEHHTDGEEYYDNGPPPWEREEAQIAGPSEEEHPAAVCPVEGGTFGKDTGRLKACRGCRIREECYVEAKRLGNIEVKQQEPERRPVRRPLRQAKETTKEAAPPPQDKPKTERRVRPRLGRTNR